MVRDLHFASGLLALPAEAESAEYPYAHYVMLEA
jgi:hypothetical protein